MNSDVANEETTDELPEDLDVTKYVGPYQFPSPKKRRTAAISIAVISLASIFFGINASNIALIVGGTIFLLVALIFSTFAWPLNVNDLDALTTAAKNSPFAVGHASAQLCFTGWTSKPLWRVVVFSTDEPPIQRGLVEINAVNQEIVSTYFDDKGTEGLEPDKKELRKVELKKLEKQRLEKESSGENNA